MQIWYVEKQTSFTVKQLNTVIDTHTQLQSLHSQSQIRWQIRRLILLGGRGIGVPPLLQVVPPRHIHTPHTHFIEGGYSCTHKHLTSLSENPSTHTSAGIFFHSLSPSSLTRSLPPSLSQHLSSFPQQPHSQSDGRWHHSVAASAEAGLWMCVCDGREKGRARHTQGHSRNINRAVSLPDQLT